MRPIRHRNTTLILIFISVLFLFFLYLLSNFLTPTNKILHENFAFATQEENQEGILQVEKKTGEKLEAQSEKKRDQGDQGLTIPVEESQANQNEINSLAVSKFQEKLDLLLELTKDGSVKLEQILSQLNKSKSEENDNVCTKVDVDSAKDPQDFVFQFQSSTSSSSSSSNNNNNISNSSQFEKGTPANSSFEVDQSDPRILEYIREHHLWPPLPIAYELEEPLEDPSKHEGQNKVVLEILKEKRNGIFVEAGANDGEFLSNTLALERDFGWTGILVEPDRKDFEALQTKHRKAWTSNVCLSVTPTPEKVKFLQFKRTSTWSKIAKVSDHHKKWKKDQMEEVEVNCFPFYSLVLALNMTTIDYFSLDIEGAEVEILKTIPFDKILIKTLSIEYDHIRLIPGADLELKTLMEANGYELVTEVTKGFAQDYIYAHKSVLEEDHGNMTTIENIPSPSPTWLQKDSNNSVLPQTTKNSLNEKSGNK